MHFLHQNCILNTFELDRKTIVDRDKNSIFQTRFTLNGIKFKIVSIKVIFKKKIFVRQSNKNIQKAFQFKLPRDCVFNGAR